MVVDLSNLGKGEEPEEGSEDEGEVLLFEPLPIKDIETSLMMVGDQGAGNAMPFIFVKYTDAGGVKPHWYTPQLAMVLGNELQRLAMVVLGQMSGGLQVAQMDLGEIMKGLTGG